MADRIRLDETAVDRNGLRHQHDRVSIKARHLSRDEHIPRKHLEVGVRCHGYDEHGCDVSVEEPVRLHDERRTDFGWFRTASRTKVDPYDIAEPDHHSTLSNLRTAWSRNS